MTTARRLRHVAIIMDGNRRWAAQHGKPKIFGHTEGAKNIERIVKTAADHGVEFLTMYALSTENFSNRSPSEIKHLFSLFAKLIDYSDLFAEHNVKFNVIGKIDELPENVREVFHQLISDTRENDALTLTLAINYGGRDEIVRATGKVDSGGLTESSFSKALDTHDLPDVDLVIRTGGFQRLSNFLLWQSAYAELYFTQRNWPEFSKEDFTEVVAWFAQQEEKKGR